MKKKIVGIRFHPWGRTSYYDLGEVKIQTGDKLIIKTDLSTEIGEVTDIRKGEGSGLGDFIQPVWRKVTRIDLEKVQEREANKDETLEICRKFIEKHDLPMKLVDCFFSFDGGRLTFIFTAESRVDFRALVRDLTRKFQKSIRLQQVGTRDEAKITGEVGPCGRRLCCQKFLKDLDSVTTDLARMQQVAHRGSERLSGVCGRLKCCLAFEKEVYEEYSKALPPIGSKIKTPKGEGEVISWNVLKRTVNVDLGNDNLIEIPIKKKNK